MSLVAILELYARLKCRKSFQKNFFISNNIEDNFSDHFELKYEEKKFYPEYPNALGKVTPLEIGFWINLPFSTRLENIVAKFQLWNYCGS